MGPILFILAMMPDNTPVMATREMPDCIISTVHRNLDQIEEGLKKLKTNQKAIYFLCKDGKNEYKGVIKGEPV
jgi:hypothetical protein